MFFRGIELTQEQKINVLVKIFGTFLLMLGSYMVVPFLAVYLTHRTGASPAVIGMVIASNPIGSVIGTMLGGSFADRYGRKKIMMIGLFSTAVIVSLYPLADSVIAFAGLVLLQGVCSRLATPAANAMLAESIPAEHRPRIYALERVAFNTGGALGPVIGSVLLVRFPTVTFELQAVLTLLYLVATWIWIQDLGFQELQANPKAKHNVSYLTVLRDRPFMLFVLAGVFMAAAYFALETILPIYLVAAYPTNGLDFYTILLVTNAVLVFFLQLKLTSLTAKWGLTRNLVSGTLLYALCYFGVALVTNQVWMYLFFLLFVLGEMLATPLIVSTAAKMSTTEVRSRYMAMINLQWMTGSFLASFLGGIVLDHFGGQGMLLFFAGLATIAGLVYVSFGKVARSRLDEPRVTPAKTSVNL
ncbi:MAG: MDR family MFS transporter [Tumebacillaceae bacterium]